MTTPGLQSSYPSEAEVTSIVAIRNAAARNQRITEAYWKLSAEVERRLLGHANWCTFATWASQQAGVTIRNEDLTELLRQQLKRSWKISGLDTKALELQHSELDLLQLVIDCVSELGPLKRTSDSVGHGNRKVFEEIGLQFARWLALFPDIASITDAEMEGFCQGLKPGPPPDGQDLLKQAFGNYRAAARAADPKEKAQLMLLANLQIGFHEQRRLQPDIEGALNGAMIDPDELAKLLRRTLIKREGIISRAIEIARNAWVALSKWLEREGKIAGVAHVRLSEGRSLEIAIVLEGDVQQQVRMLITDLMMTLWFPPADVVKLGHDLTRSYPEAMQKLTNSAVLKILAEFGADSDSTSGSGTQDWANFNQRMRFIAVLFRAYGVDKSLFDPLMAKPTNTADLFYTWNSIEQTNRPDDLSGDLSDFKDKSTAIARGAIGS